MSDTLKLTLLTISLCLLAIPFIKHWFSQISFLIKRKSIYNNYKDNLSKDTVLRMNRATYSLLMGATIGNRYIAESTSKGITFLGFPFEIIGDKNENN